MLLGCGTVVATAPNGSLVRVTREKCVGCPGACLRFAKGDSELWLEEQFQVGTKVEIETSSVALVVGTSITMGMPLITAGATYYFSSSWMITAGATFLSVLLVLACCRTEKFRLLLVPHVRNVV